MNTAFMSVESTKILQCKAKQSRAEKKSTELQTKERISIEQKYVSQSKIEMFAKERNTGMLQSGRAKISPQLDSWICISKAKM
jgi:hypothetical protein